MAHRGGFKRQGDRSQKHHERGKSTMRSERDSINTFFNSLIGIHKRLLDAKTPEALMDGIENANMFIRSILDAQGGRDRTISNTYALFGSMVMRVHTPDEITSLVNRPNKESEVFVLFSPVATFASYFNFVHEATGIAVRLNRKFKVDEWKFDLEYAVDKKGKKREDKDEDVLFPLDEPADMHSLDDH
jgi:hypothetical protein